MDFDFLFFVQDSQQINIYVCMYILFSIIINFFFKKNLLHDDEKKIRQKIINFIRFSMYKKIIDNF